MNILPVIFKQICQFSTLNFSKGHTFLEILLPDLSPLWTPVLENMNLFSVQFRKGNNLPWGPCAKMTKEVFSHLEIVILFQSLNYKEPIR